MTKDDFFTRLESSLGRALTNSELDQLNPPLKTNYRYSVPEYLDISEVGARVAEGKAGYWLYDKTTRTWIINMNIGSHEVFTGTLYNIITHQYLWEDDAAEKYIKEHYGFFLSGAMNMYIPIKDEFYNLSAEELIFDKAKGPLNWRGIRY